MEDITLKLDWRQVPDESAESEHMSESDITSPEKAMKYILMKARGRYSQGFYPGFSEMQNPFIKEYVNNIIQIDPATGWGIISINNEHVIVGGEYVLPIIRERFPNELRAVYNSIKEMQIPLTIRAIGDNYMSLEPPRTEANPFGSDDVWNALGIMRRAMDVLGTDTLNDTCFTFIKTQLDQYLQEYVLNLHYEDPIEKYKLASKFCGALHDWKKYFLVDRGQSLLDTSNYLHTIIPPGPTDNNYEKKDKLERVNDIQERLLRLFREGRYSSLKLNWAIPIDVPKLESFSGHEGERVVFMIYSVDTSVRDILPKIWSCWSATIRKDGSLSDTEKLYTSEDFHVVKGYGEDVVRYYNNNFGIKEEYKKDLTTKCWYYESIDEGRFLSGDLKLQWQESILKIGDEVFDNTSGEILGKIKEFVGPSKSYVIIEIPNEFKYLLEENPSGLITMRTEEVDSNETYDWKYPNIDREANLKLDWADIPNDLLEEFLFKVGPNQIWQSADYRYLITSADTVAHKVSSLGVHDGSIHVTNAKWSLNPESSSEFKKVCYVSLARTPMKLIAGRPRTSSLQLDWADIKEEYSFEELRSVIGPNQVWRFNTEDNPRFLHTGPEFIIGMEGFHDELIFSDAIYSNDAVKHPEFGVRVSLTGRYEPYELISGKIKISSLQPGDKVRINSDVYQMDFQNGFGYDSRNLKGKTFEVEALSEENNTIKLKSDDIVLNEKLENEDKTFGKVAWMLNPDVIFIDSNEELLEYLINSFGATGVVVTVIMAPFISGKYEFRLSQYSLEGDESNVRVHYDGDSSTITFNSFEEAERYGLEKAESLGFPFYRAKGYLRAKQVAEAQRGLNWATDIPQDTYSFDDLPNVLGPNQVWDCSFPDGYNENNIARYFHTGRNYRFDTIVLSEVRGKRQKTLICDDARWDDAAEIHMDHFSERRISKDREPFKLVLGEIKTSSLKLDWAIPVEKNPSDYIGWLVKADYVHPRDSRKKHKIYYGVIVAIRGNEVFAIWETSQVRAKYNYLEAPLRFLSINGNASELTTLGVDEITIEPIEELKSVREERQIPRRGLRRGLEWANIPEFKVGDEVAWLHEGNDGKKYTAIGKIEQMVFTRSSKEGPYVTGHFTEEDGTTHSLGMFVPTDELHRFPPTEPYVDASLKLDWDVSLPDDTTGKKPFQTASEILYEHGYLVDYKGTGSDRMSEYHIDYLFTPTVGGYADVASLINDMTHHINYIKNALKYVEGIEFPEPDNLYITLEDDEDANGTTYMMKGLTDAALRLDGINPPYSVHAIEYIISVPFASTHSLKLDWANIPQTECNSLEELKDVIGPNQIWKTRKFDPKQCEYFKTDNEIKNWEVISAEIVKITGGWWVNDPSEDLPDEVSGYIYADRFPFKLVDNVKLDWNFIKIEDMYRFKESISHRDLFDHGVGYMVSRLNSHTPAGFQLHPNIYEVIRIDNHMNPVVVCLKQLNIAYGSTIELKYDDLLYLMEPYEDTTEIKLDWDMQAGEGYTGQTIRNKDNHNLILARSVKKSNGESLSPTPSLKIINHSPNGFNWGYGGSGPAQLAIAILLDYTDDDNLALAAHQKYKEDVISKLPEDEWYISNTSIQKWLVDNGYEFGVPDDPPTNPEMLRDDNPWDELLWQVPVSKYELTIRRKKYGYGAQPAYETTAADRRFDLTLEEVINIINLAPLSTFAADYYSVVDVIRRNRNLDLDYPDAMIYGSYLNNAFTEDTGYWYDLTEDELRTVESLITVPQRKNIAKP